MSCCSLEVLHSVFHEGEGFNPDIHFTLSAQTINELITLCILAPIMRTDLRASAADTLYMMDASPFYLGELCSLRTLEAH